jgi:uncharacterized protein
MSSFSAIPSVAGLAQPSFAATGVDEELAGPPHRAANLHDATRPVAREERISSIDVLRGFALMGILIENITDFGLPVFDYLFPLSTVKPVFSGPHWRVNTVLWFLRWIVAEGKTRALFRIIFGAGVILLTSRAEARGAGVRIADIFARRNLWLAIFGILHCYLIWNGDILFFYGVTALLFLFPCRHLKARTLFWAAGIVLLLNTVFANGLQTYSLIQAHEAAISAQAKVDAHRPIANDERIAILIWRRDDSFYRPPPRALYAAIAQHQGWLNTFEADNKSAMTSETYTLYTSFGDWLGTMLLGMALYKNGFLSGKLRTRSYVLYTLTGLGIAWPLVGVCAWHVWKGGFDQIQASLWLQAPYDIGRVSGAIGTAALVLLLLRAGIFRWLFARIAAVGQMALSNYILTSVTMRAVFVWSPLHWYGYLDYYKLYYCVAAMWAVNLIFSTLWLRYFRFGPMEWLWRSLTYWKRQPMLLS